MTYKYDNSGIRPVSNIKTNATKYPEKNAREFRIGAMHFSLNDVGDLWNVGSCVYEWRYPGETEWTKTSGHGYLPVGRNTFEIREIGWKSYYRIDKDGYELVVEKSLEEMLKKIIEKVDFIECRTQMVYALLPETEVAIGCIDAIKVLEDAKLIQVVHSSEERSLYLVLKNKVDEKHFENHRKRVEDLYERIVRR